jgi:hypothetical protein
MKILINYCFSLPLLAISLFLCSACKDARNQPVQEGPVSTPKAVEARPQPPATPQYLEGLYVISEVQEKGDSGKVLMVPTGSDISFAFMQDGTFSRSTKRQGKAFHKDGGNYALQGNQLTLTATISEKEILPEPKQKIYTFTLSPDGEELKLTAESGKTAVFRRQVRARKAGGK